MQFVHGEHGPLPRNSVQIYVQSMEGKVCASVSDVLNADRVGVIAETVLLTNEVRSWPKSQVSSLRPVQALHQGYRPTEVSG